MELELLMDLYGFLPEKYFLSRVFSKSTFDTKTRITFADYNRNHYTILYRRFNNVLWLKDNHIRHEYGPCAIFYGEHHIGEVWDVKNGVKDIYRGLGRFKGYKSIRGWEINIMTLNGRDCTEKEKVAFYEAIAEY